jgi:hypothetical protein
VSLRSEQGVLETETIRRNTEVEILRTRPILSNQAYVSPLPTQFIFRLVRSVSKPILKGHWNYRFSLYIAIHMK